MKLTLKDLEKHIQGALQQAQEDGVEVPENPTLIFSIGKPTEGDILEIEGMGIAETEDGETHLFFSLQKPQNLRQEFEAMLKEVLGDSRAGELIALAKEQKGINGSEADDLGNMETEGNA